MYDCDPTDCHTKVSRSHNACKVWPGQFWTCLCGQNALRLNNEKSLIADSKLESFDMRSMHLLRSGNSVQPPSFVRCMGIGDPI